LLQVLYLFVRLFIGFIYNTLNTPRNPKASMSGH